MSSPATTAGATAIHESMIAIKLSIDGVNRKFKLPLRDLVAPVFADKINSILQVSDHQKLLLERFSDSGNAYVPLEPTNASAYKQLYRAGKAKQKLKLRATLLSLAPAAEATSPCTTPTQAAHTEIKKEPQQTNTFQNVFSTMNGIAHPAAGSHDRAAFFEQLAHEDSSLEQQLSRLMQPHRASAGGVWQVFCNNCDKAMSDAHFHCSICDDGDYDLCHDCVKSGVSCLGEEHWLIKRFIKNGKVVNSTTETIAPRSSKFTQALPKQEAPVAFKVEPKSEPAPTSFDTRTCNACVRVLPEEEFVTCTVCPDVDYCVPCIKEKTGHHPAHSFKPAVAKAQILANDPELKNLCKPNRNTVHAAICDLCESSITGIRYKCLSCPDFDVCTGCHYQTSVTHPHRFVPIYEPLAFPVPIDSKHHGIYCDGKLCNGQPWQSYIKGIRYKCAICPDFDLCGNCEAHPDNDHNVTHPMIKMKTPVRNMSCSAFEDALPTRSRAACRPTANTSTTTLPAYTPAAPKAVNSAELDAHFVKDVIADGTSFNSDVHFTQTWTLRNPGPHAWPAGVAVCNIGGDNMLNLDRSGYTTVFDLDSAKKSNATTHAVAVGQTKEFSVNMRAPSREGKHISYWRLKAADGTPFGHKLWCDIEVSNKSKVAAPNDDEQRRTAQNSNMIQAMVEAAMRRAAISGQFASVYRQAASQDLQDMQGESSTQTFVPEYLVPVVIGRRGETIQDLQERSGCHINILAENKSFGGWRAINLIGTSEAVHKAQQLIDELMKSGTPARSMQATVEDADDSASATLHESQMVMPTLERDGTPSASNSMHSIKVETAPESVAATETKSESDAGTVATEEKVDELSELDFESADAGSDKDDEDDDGFLTDEEYDILDASDEEGRL